MLGGSTVYDIQLRYNLTDKATAGMQSMARSADMAARSTGGLRNTLMGLGGAVAGLGVLGLGKRMLIDYNNQIDQMQIGLSTVIASQLHLPFAEARKEADRLFLVFQDMAKKSPATTKDYVEMANGIARAVTAAGMGTEDLKDLTGGAVIAAKAFGIRADMAALDIEQMLAGNVTNRDRMAKALLGSQGINYTDFNKMSQQQRNQITKSALGSDAVKSAAEAFGNSFQGQLSTIQDNLEIIFGQVGLPLMKEITKEVRKWNQWIERNPQKIQKFVQDFGGALAQGFGFVRDVVVTLIENKDTLLAIAKAWLVFKGVNMLGGGLAGAAGGIMGMVKRFQEASMTMNASGIAASNGLRGLVGALGGPMGAINAVSLLAGAAYGLYSWWRAEKQREQERNKDYADFFRGGIGGAVDRYTAMRTQDISKEASKRGMTVGQFQASEEGQNFMANQASSREGLQYAVKLGAKEMIEKGFLEMEGEGWRARLKETEKFKQMQASKEFGTDKNFQQAARFMDALALAMKQNKDLVEELSNEIKGKEPETEEQLGLMGKGATNEVNVKIEKIEVQSDDPDRFVFGMINAFEDINANPTQASDTIRAIGR